jgi:hypothetical protein
MRYYYYSSGLRLLLQGLLADLKGATTALVLVEFPLLLAIWGVV